MSTTSAHNSKNAKTTRPTSTRARLAAIVLTVTAIAAACGSDSEGTISLGDDGIVVDSSTDETDAPSDSEGERINFRWDTFDGSTKALSDLSEGPVVVNFFASWCPSCVAEMPDFQAVSQSFGTDVQFVGLAMQDRPEAATALVDSTGVTYEVGADPDGDIFAQMGGLGMPTTVFIDASGTVTSVHSGALTAGSLTDKINDELLSQES